MYPAGQTETEKGFNMVKGIEKKKREGEIKLKQRKKKTSAFTGPAAKIIFRSSKTIKTKKKKIILYNYLPPFIRQILPQSTRQRAAGSPFVVFQLQCRSTVTLAGFCLHQGRCERLSLWNISRCETSCSLVILLLLNPRIHRNKFTLRLLILSQIKKAKATRFLRSSSLIYGLPMLVSGSNPNQETQNPCYAVNCLGASPERSIVGTGGSEERSSIQQCFYLTLNKSLHAC